MRAHIIENNKVVNTIEIESLDLIPDLFLVDAELGGAIGDEYDFETGEFTSPQSTKIVPQSVTMRQARRALLEAGLLSQVPVAISALPSPQKEVAEIEWEYSSEVFRNRELVVMLGVALGLTEEELDNLFIRAAEL